MASVCESKLVSKRLKKYRMATCVTSDPSVYLFAWRRRVGVDVGAVLRVAPGANDPVSRESASFAGFLARFCLALQF